MEFEEAGGCDLGFFVVAQEYWPAFAFVVVRRGPLRVPRVTVDAGVGDGDPIVESVDDIGRPLIVGGLGPVVMVDDYVACAFFMGLGVLTEVVTGIFQNALDSGIDLNLRYSVTRGVVTGDFLFLSWCCRSGLGVV